LKLTILNGDQEHDFDAARLKSAGADVLQLNTMSSCHLDASMISRELGLFVSPEPQLLVIENVGNLVCPAAFDLGETMKVALLSITEGEDKPSKYPLLFHEAGLIVLTKMDLLPHLDWDLELCKEHIRRVNASAPIICLSAKTGDGLESWIQFLRGDEIEQSA
jgi:hydrogenase nickel incorporation protein HypB